MNVLRINYVGCTSTAGWIHPHVERRILAEGKAPFRRIELKGRNPEIEKHAIDSGDPEFRQYRTGFGEIAVQQSHPVAEGRELRFRSGQCLRVPVKADQSAIRCSFFKDQSGMTAAADGAVQGHFTGAGGQ